jgi:hypothetical protein
MRKYIYSTLFVILGVLFSSMTATQAIPSQTTYNACVKKSSGAIRLVAATKKCAKKERKISWIANGIPGPQGVQGEPGPQGETGEAGKDGGYEVLITAADFATYSFSTTTKLEQVNFDGAPRLVWTLPGATSIGGAELIWASFARPESWDGATGAKVTFYWIAEDASGVVSLSGWGGSLLVGNPVDLTNSASGTGGFLGTPTANVLSSTESQIQLTPSSDLIDVSFMRNYNTNTNTGKIRVLGAKLEPVFD